MIHYDEDSFRNPRQKPKIDQLVRLRKKTKDGKLDNKGKKRPRHLTQSYLSFDSAVDSIITHQPQFAEPRQVLIDSNTSFFKRILLGWVRPLKGQIQNDRISFKLPEDLDVTENEKKLEDFYTKNYTYGLKNTLSKMTWMHLRSYYLLVLFYKMLRFISLYLLFIYLKKFRDFDLDHKNDFVVCFSAILVIEIVGNVLRNLVKFRVQKIGLVIDSALSSLLLNKMLKKSIDSDMRFEKSEFKFLLSTSKKMLQGYPREKLNSVEFMFHLVLSIGFGFYVFNSNLFFVTFCVYLIIIGLVFLNVKNLRSRRIEDLNIEKVKRVKNVVNVLKNIFYVKARGWDPILEDTINKLRDRELGHLHSINTIENIWNFLIWLFTFLSIVIFFVMTFHQDRINEQTLIDNSVDFDIYAQMLLLMYLLISQTTLNKIVVVANPKNFFNALEFLLDSEEVDKDRHKKTKYETPNPINALTMKDCSLFWDVENLELQQKKKSERDAEEFLLNKSKEREKKQKRYEFKMEQMEDFDEIIDSMEKNSLKYTFNITAEGESEIYKEFPKKRSEYQLIDINLTVKKGDFCFVFGEINSGKSSLLKSIIGEMKLDLKAKPTFIHSGRLHFFDSRPWIIDGSLRENIILGDKYDEERYSNALKWSKLENLVDMNPEEDSFNCSDFVTFDTLFKTKVECARAIYSK